MRYGRDLEPQRDAGEQEVWSFIGTMVYLGIVAFVIVLLLLCFWLVSLHPATATLH